LSQVGQEVALVYRHNMLVYDMSVIAAVIGLQRNHS